VQGAFGSELSTGGKRFGKQVTDMTEKIYESLCNISITYVLHMYYICTGHELFLFALASHCEKQSKAQNKTRTES
jgi:hypothetical protein